MTVSPTAPIVAQESAIRTLTGPQARLIAAAQGHTWEGIAGTSAIAERVETVEHLDARGDQLMAAHRRHLARAAAMARRECAPQTEAMLHELIASAALLDEIDTHEDMHRREIGGHATQSGSAMRRVSSIQGALLGHKEAICGRTRPPLDGVGFEPCQKPVGHAAAGRLCVFEAIATTPASPA